MKDGEPFAYDVPSTPLSPEPLPTFLRWHLLDPHHLCEEEAATVRRAEAQQLFDHWCSHQP